MGAIAILFFLTSFHLSAQFSDGSGTQADPYQITSRQDMEALADSVNSVVDINGNNWSYNKFFKVMIDITDTVRTTIGKPDDQIGTFFRGNFDGNNKKITLAIRNYSGKAGFHGLFATAYKAKINNVIIDGYIKIEGESVWSGGIVGWSINTDISHCINICSEISVPFVCIGGIVGHFEGYGVVEYCQNYSNITAQNAIGGIVGHIASASEIKISHCQNYGNITTTNPLPPITAGQSGGIVGFCDISYEINDTAVAISNCTNSGNINSADGNCIGGIIGMSTATSRYSEYPISNYTTISNCVNIGTVTGYDNVGGIAGADINSVNNVNSGLVIGYKNIGGIIGSGYDSRYASGDDKGISTKISNCINTGVVIGNDNVGGIIGNDSNSIVKNSYYDKQMCTYGGIEGKDIAGQAEGFLTKEMTGDGLKAKLGTENWVYSPNLYPRLKALQDDTASLVAASPAYLYDANILDYDAHTNVRKDFTVNTENGVKWSQTVGNVNVVGTNATLINNGADTLVASIGNAKKLVPININKAVKPNPDSVNLILKSNPVDGGSTIGSGKYEKGQTARIEAIANNEYLFINWTDEQGNIISTNEIDSVTIIKDSVLMANFEAIPMPSATFIIRASEHKLVSPNAANYEIPIYITANKDIINANLYIDKLVIEMDRSIYSPTNATSTIANNMRNIILTNIKLPELVEGEEIVLCTIKGDVLLGDIDSSGIVIKEVKFSNNMKLEQLDTINGYITLDICREGGERLIDVLPYSPSIRVVKNPVTSELEVTCRTIELGNYELNIIDLQGNISPLKTFKMSNKAEHTHNFKFSTADLGNGSYIIEMLTPSNQKFTDKFVVAK